MKEERRGPFEVVRVAVGANLRRAAVERAALKVPIHVARDEEVEPPVAVVVEPARARRPARRARLRLLRHVLESAIAAVTIQSRATQAGDVEVYEAVAVEVSGRRAHRVAFAAQSRALGHVLEGAVRLLMIETIPEARLGFVGPRAFRHRVLKSRAGGEEEVEPTVVVVVEECDPSAHRLRQVLLRGGRGRVAEVDAGLRGDVCEADGRERLRRGAGWL